MADALFEIGRETENWQLNRKFVQGTTAWWDVSLVSHICIGYLPLPSDASSPAVAETAGKWLSRCEAVDRAAVLRELLADEALAHVVGPTLMAALLCGWRQRDANLPAEMRREPRDADTRVFRCSDCNEFGFNTQLGFIQFVCGAEILSDGTVSLVCPKTIAQEATDD